MFFLSFLLFHVCGFLCLLALHLVVLPWSSTELVHSLPTCCFHLFIYLFIYLSVYLFYFPSCFPSPPVCVYIYIYLSLTLALDGWWVVIATPWLLYPRERPGIHCIGGWLSPRASLDGCGKSRPPPGFDLRTVQGSNHCGDEIFHTRPDRL